MTPKMPSATMMATIAMTTADVVALPTAAALRPQAIPCMQPQIATSSPNTALLIRPEKTIDSGTALNS